MKAQPLFDLNESLHASAAAALQTHSTAKIRKMVLMLAKITKDKLADKVTESHSFAYLTDKITDTSKGTTSSYVCQILRC